MKERKGIYEGANKQQSQKINGMVETSREMHRKNPQLYRLLNYISTSLRNDYALFPSDTTVLHPYEPVGCFKDDRDPRALPILIQKYSVNETDLANSFADIIHACATEVFEYGLRYFGVEYQHECWSGVNGGITYNRYGRSENCLSNYSVGDEWTIFVYRFVEG